MKNCRKVLIESDWNLKMGKIRTRSRALSINRIRLEFKEYGKVQVGEVTMVLIESDWNLKWHSGATDEVAGSEY